MELLLAQVAVGWDLRTLITVCAVVFAAGSWTGRFRGAPTKDYVHNAINGKVSKCVSIAVCDERLKKIESDFAHVIEGQARQEKMLTELLNNNRADKRK